MDSTSSLWEHTNHFWEDTNYLMHLQVSTHRKVMLAEPSRLISRKLAASTELLTVVFCMWF